MLPCTFFQALIFNMVFKGLPKCPHNFRINLTLNTLIIRVCLSSSKMDPVFTGMWVHGSKRSNYWCHCMIYSVVVYPNPVYIDQGLFCWISFKLKPTVLAVIYVWWVYVLTVALFPPSCPVGFVVHRNGNFSVFIVNHLNLFFFI